MNFQPDYRIFEACMKNCRPERLPLYEHMVSPDRMQAALGKTFPPCNLGNPKDSNEFFRCYCDFFKTMTYDVVSFEVCITPILPETGALLGGKPGPIQNREDFEQFAWESIPERYWAQATPLLDSLVNNLPTGMKAVGGVGNGVFEISEDLVGLEYLPFIQADDPELYEMLYDRIGDVMLAIWKEFLSRYKDHFVACRIGDDLGYKSSLLTNPRTVRNHIVPQYKKIIQAVHDAGKLFLWHSCGCIFEIMPDMIAAGIDAKHSNEDAIAPFDRWIESYGEQIGLMGGFDMDFLCRHTPQEVFDRVVTDGTRFRNMAKGYALGSGNSIPEYVPTENYLAMVQAAQKIRQDEVSG